MSNVPNSAPNVITAAGAVTAAKFNNIHAAGALALTLASPTIDGQEIWFTDETGHAHTIVVAAAGSPPTSGLITGEVTTLTFGATAGDSVGLMSRNGFWQLLALNGVTIS